MAKLFLLGTERPFDFVLVHPSVQGFSSRSFHQFLPAHQITGAVQEHAFGFQSVAARSAGFLLDPDSRLASCWSFVVVSAIAYNMFIVPFRVAFAPFEGRVDVLWSVGLLGHP